MPIMFNSVLREAGFSLADVCLVRHQDRTADRGRRKFGRPYWASFVGTHDNDTLFVGLYAAKHVGLLEHDTPKPHQDGIDLPGSCDLYALTLENALSEKADDSQPLRFEHDGIENASISMRCLTLGAL